jgi:Holliday junction resolvase RusA-like endonuclease
MSEELMEDLEKANNGEIPSPFGRAEYVVPGTPASVQSKKAVRDAYLTTIRNFFKGTKYLLTGEIILNVTWLLPTKSRFETDTKADIDNCLKPIIDAFTGPDGLFIDDCQLRGLYICWRHITSDNERLLFEFEYQADQYTPKDELAFVQLDGALCTPVNLNWPKETIKIWVEFLKTNQVHKNMLENLGAPYPAVAGFLGVSQPFHRTRVNGFKVLSLTEFASYAQHETRVYQNN